MLGRAATGWNGEGVNDRRRDVRCQTRDTKPRREGGGSCARAKPARQGTKRFAQCPGCAGVPAIERRAARIGSEASRALTFDVIDEEVERPLRVRLDHHQLRDTCRRTLSM